MSNFVHCRIGSSEINGTQAAIRAGVHCRIGSSENDREKFREGGKVHCRIGSSENTPLAQEGRA